MEIRCLFHRFGCQIHRFRAGDGAELRQIFKSFALDLTVTENEFILRAVAPQKNILYPVMRPNLKGVQIAHL